MPVVVRECVPLAPRTSLGIGGDARFFAEVATVEALGEVLAWAAGSGLAVHVLGGGSNVVVADRGFDGVVIRVGADRVDLCDEGPRVRVDAEAGAPWDAVVQAAIAGELSGIECLAGIPGDVGATPIQNVGAYGQEVSDTLIEVEAISRADGARHVFSRVACDFGYRDSVFKRSERDRWIVWRVAFALRKEPPAAPIYAELRDHLAADQAPLSVARVATAVTTLRRRKAMVLDAADPDSRSAGSFFVNPVLSGEAFDRFAASDAVRALGAAPPAFRQSDGSVKVPAAWLIERAGFVRGTRDGRVGLSSKHALAIVNLGDARASDVVRLASSIRSRVRETFGVTLTPEAQFVGFAPEDLASALG